MGTRNSFCKMVSSKCMGLLSNCYLPCATLIHLQMWGISWKPAWSTPLGINTQEGTIPSVTNTTLLLARSPVSKKSSLMRPCLGRVRIPHFRIHCHLYTHRPHICHMEGHVRDIYIFTVKHMCQNIYTQQTLTYRHMVAWNAPIVTGRLKMKDNWLPYTSITALDL